jgi:hypothetical protein
VPIPPRRGAAVGRLKHVIAAIMQIEVDTVSRRGMDTVAVCWSLT